MKKLNPMLKALQDVKEAQENSKIILDEYNKLKEDYNRLQQICCGILLSAKTKKVTVKEETFDLLDKTGHNISATLSKDKTKFYFEAVPIAGESSPEVVFDKEEEKDEVCV